MIRTTTAPDNSLSLDRISRLRSEAHATIRHRAAEVISISAALEAPDHATQRSVATGLADDRQALISAARRLSSLLDGSAVRE